LTYIQRTAQVSINTVSASVANEQVLFWTEGGYDSKESVYTQFFKKKHLTLVSFGSTRFDFRAIQNVANRVGLKIPKQFDDKIDLGWLIVHRTLGTPKGSLKSAGPYFGYEWTDPTMKGDMSGMSYSNYLHSGEKPNWQELLQYNKDDVMATYWVLESILKLDEVDI
jgi:predicted RecB family nuclease